jgi:hypothetical protein
MAAVFKMALKLPLFSPGLKSNFFEFFFKFIYIYSYFMELFFSKKYKMADFFKIVKIWGNFSKIFKLIFEKSKYNFF